MPVSRSLAEGTTADGEIEQKAAVSFSLPPPRARLYRSVVGLVRRGLLPPLLLSSPSFLCLSCPLVQKRGKKGMEDKSSAKKEKKN